MFSAKTEEERERDYILNGIIGDEESEALAGPGDNPAFLNSNNPEYNQYKAKMKNMKTSSQLPKSASASTLPPGTLPPQLQMKNTPVELVKTLGPAP